MPKSTRSARKLNGFAALFSNLFRSLRSTERALKVRTVSRYIARCHRLSLQGLTTARDILIPPIANIIPKIFLIVGSGIL